MPPAFLYASLPLYQGRDIATAPSCNPGIKVCITCVTFALIMFLHRTQFQRTAWCDAATNLITAGPNFACMQAFTVLERLDPAPEYLEGKKGACVGTFQVCGSWQLRVLCLCHSLTFRGVRSMQPYSTAHLPASAAHLTADRAVVAVFRPL